MSAQPKEHVLPPGKMAELLQKFDRVPSASTATDRLPRQSLPSELGLAFGAARPRLQHAMAEPRQQPGKRQSHATMSLSVAAADAGKSSPHRSSMPLATTSSSPSSLLTRPLPRADDRDRHAPVLAKQKPAPTASQGTGGIKTPVSGSGAAAASDAVAAPSSANNASGRSLASESIEVARLARVWEDKPTSREKPFGRTALSAAAAAVASPLQLLHERATGSPGRDQVGRNRAATVGAGHRTTSDGSRGTPIPITAASSSEPAEPATPMPRIGGGVRSTRPQEFGDDLRPVEGQPAAHCLADNCSSSGREDDSTSSRRARVTAQEAETSRPSAGMGNAGDMPSDGSCRPLPEPRESSERVIDRVSDDSDDDSDGSSAAAPARAGLSGSQAPPGSGHTASTTGLPGPPPKPRRTFEHDIYVQSKAAIIMTAAATRQHAPVAASVSSGTAAAVATGARQPAAADAAGSAETAAVSTRPYFCLHHYEEIDFGSEVTPGLSAVSAEPPARKCDEDPVYESLGPTSSAGAYLQPGVAMAASPAAAGQPPPLPARPPPKLDVPVLYGAASSSSSSSSSRSSIGLTQRTGDAVRSPTSTGGSESKRGLLRLLRWHQPHEHRKKDAMKRFASAECIIAAVASGAEQAFTTSPLWTPSSPAGFSSSMHGAKCDSTSSSSQVFSFPEPVHYASSMLIPAQTLTRSSSHGNLSGDAAALGKSHLSRMTVPGRDDGLAEPAAQSPIVPQQAFKKYSLKRHKVAVKLHNAFALLGHAGRRMRSASLDQGFAVASDDNRDILQRRLQHCSLVKERSIYASPSKIREYINGMYPQLFSYAVVVGLQSVHEARADAAAMSDDGVTSNKKVPFVIYKFPAKVDVESLHVPLFCFPDADSWQERNAQDVETYSFVLTSSDGSRLYGYCKRYTLTNVVDGQQVVMPEVVCITSPLSATKFFSEILDEFVRRRRVMRQRAEEFIEAAYGKPLPRPGGSISIRAMDDAEQSELLTFARSVDSRVEDASCACLLQALSSRQIVSIFGAIVNERKIVLCAEKPSKLSTCISALVSLLYPFSWQHTLVPVLPPSLIDVVCSPTPFVVGVLTSCQQQLGDLDTDEVLVVNLDTQKIIASVGDEHSILPKKLYKALVSALDMSKTESKYQDTMISEAFLYFFFESLGSIDEYIVVSEDGKKDFQKDRFLRAAASSAAADFVKWFSHTQMFDAYVVEKCEGYTTSSTGDYEDRFVSWLQDPVISSERTPVKELFRNLFYKGKQRK